MIFAILRDGGGAHDPEQVMSLWSTKAAAEAEIVRLQTQVYMYDGEPQRFWLYPVRLDHAYSGGIDEDTHLGVAYPPYD